VVSESFLNRCMDRCRLDLVIVPSNRTKLQPVDRLIGGLCARVRILFVGGVTTFPAENMSHHVEVACELRVHQCLVLRLALAHLLKVINEHLKAEGMLFQRPSQKKKGRRTLAP